jgi:tetratricopeptide (TPR) repeat protein
MLCKKPSLNPLSIATKLISVLRLSAPGRMIKRFLFVSLFLLPHLVVAQETFSWIGQKVVTKYDYPVKIGDQLVEKQNLFHVYTVKQTNGDWLLVGWEGKEGWLPASQVVLFDQAINFYTQEIAANPGNYRAWNQRGIIWDEKKEYDIAIADYNEAIRLNPASFKTYQGRGIAWHNKKEYDKAIGDFNEVMRLDPKGADAYNELAWLWATCPDERFRDGKKAVALATRACELTEWKDAEILDTLAAAYAELGDFEKAVEWQEKTNKRLAEELRKGGEERLKLYKEKKPYRETE